MPISLSVFDDIALKYKTKIRKQVAENGFSGLHRSFYESTHKTEADEPISTREQRIRLNHEMFPTLKQTVGS